jgi:hypothetical protein
MFTADGTDKADKNMGIGRNHAVRGKMPPLRGFRFDWIVFYKYAAPTGLMLYWQSVLENSGKDKTRTGWKE